jgi:hypothetical protein
MRGEVVNLLMCPVICVLQKQLELGRQMAERIALLKGQHAAAVHVQKAN